MTITNNDYSVNKLQEITIMSINVAAVVLFMYKFFVYMNCCLHELIFFKLNYTRCLCILKENDDRHRQKDENLNVWRV